MTQTNECSSSQGSGFFGSLFGSLGLSVDFGADQRQLQGATTSGAPPLLPKVLNRQQPHPMHQGSTAHPASSSQLLKGSTRQHLSPSAESHPRLGQLHPVSHPGEIIVIPRVRHPGQLYARERISKAVQTSLKPKGPGGNDTSRLERFFNVITSVPFVGVGLHTARQRRTKEGRQFGASMVAVGVAATAYHAAGGELRKHLRKLDYWTISLSTTLMNRALFPTMPQALKSASLASLAIVPFQPFAVSALNAGIMEAGFCSKAIREKSLRREYRRHALAAGVGGACFLLEDVAIRHHQHWAHSLWHCMACYGVASTNVLLRERERSLHLGAVSSL